MLKIIKYVKYIVYGPSDSKIKKPVSAVKEFPDLKNPSFLYLHAEILERDLQASQKTPHARIERQTKRVHVRN